MAVIFVQRNQIITSLFETIYKVDLEIQRETRMSWCCQAHFIAANSLRRFNLVCKFYYTPCNIYYGIMRKPIIDVLCLSCLTKKTIYVCERWWNNPEIGKRNKTSALLANTRTDRMSNDVSLKINISLWEYRALYFIFLSLVGIYMDEGIGKQHIKVSWRLNISSKANEPKRSAIWSFTRITFRRLDEWSRQEYHACIYTKYQRFYFVLPEKDFLCDVIQFAIFPLFFVLFSANFFNIYEP